jgi:hypothetical protein
LTVALATVVHDPEKELLPKLQALLPGVADLFDAIAVMASEAAPAETLALYDAHGAVIAADDGPPSGLTIGKRRRGCVAAALQTGTTHVVYSDTDHVLRWFERDPDDLRAALAALGEADFTIFGRPPAVFAQAPAPLRDTEGLCNEFYERLTGRPWELFIALRGMSAATARLIVDECDEDTIATDVAWPLFVESRGCTLGYREVDVPYENHAWFASGISERDAMERDPKQWAMRFLFGKQMFDAFARWGPQASKSISTWRSMLSTARCG